MRSTAIAINPEPLFALGPRILLPTSHGTTTKAPIVERAPREAIESPLSSWPIQPAISQAVVVPSRDTKLLSPSMCLKSGSGRPSARPRTGQKRLSEDMALIFKPNVMVSSNPSSSDETGVPGYLNP